MQFRTFRKPAMLGLGFSATLAAALSGCGNPTADKDNAIVVPPPNANVTSQPTASKGATAKPGATASTDTAKPGGTSEAPVKAEGWGTLKGQIVYGGTPEPPKVIQAVGKAEKDPNVCAKDTPIVLERLVVNPANKGVKNVFVYLQRPTAVNEDAKKEAASRHVEFDQKNCTYIPHALGVMTGQTVTLKSSDPTNHNVNFQLKNLNQNPLIAPGTSKDVVPDSPERAPGPVSCSIHPWMMAYWLVLDHPYFAVTDDNGNYEIKNAPAGTQKVVVWQEAATYVTASSGEAVNIKPNETTTKDYTIDPAEIRPGG